MKLTLCSYELSKLAKEKGFDWVTRNYYEKETKELDYFVYYEFDQFEFLNDGESILSKFNNFEDWCIASKPECSAPELSLLTKWFRDVHEILIDIDWNVHSKAWPACVYKYKEYPTKFHCGVEDSITYELALEQGLTKAFELI